jgi:hypothetical protein
MENAWEVKCYIKLYKKKKRDLIFTQRAIIHNNYYYIFIEADQKFSMHLITTIQKVTSNVQSAPRLSPDIY